MRRVSAIAVICSLLLVGCGSKVSHSNYDKINTGMTEQEVQAILGTPTEQKTAGAAVGGMDMSAKTMVWKAGDKAINVVFMNGKVTGKTQQNL